MIEIQQKRGRESMSVCLFASYSVT